MNKSLLVKVFGNTSNTRVLEFVITEMMHYDFSMTEVAKATKISWGTINTIWKELKKKKFIVKTRKVGNANMYQANKNSPEIIALKNMILEIASEQQEEIPIKVA